MIVSHKKNILILIDIQNDFLPGGSLAVPQGDKVIPIANELMERRDFFDQVIATQDWHPKNHKSFASNHVGKSVAEFVELHGVKQILWPDHCVQNTDGAKFSNKLHVEHIDKIFKKGMNPKIDSYSGFFDNDHKSSTGLGEYLKEIGATDVYMMGLATDYCVKFSAIDCVKFGFRTYVVEDGCRGINLNSNDVENSLREMEKVGVQIVKNLTS